MKIRPFDIETNMAHDTMWCMVEKMGDSYRCYADDYSRLSQDEIRILLEEYNCVLLPWSLFKVDPDVHYTGHNAIGFDCPKMRDLVGHVIPDDQQEDTLILSRMFNTNIDGGHSLKAWGKRLGKEEKIEYDKHDEPLTFEKLVYCIRDVKLVEDLHVYLTSKMDVMKFDTKCRQMEMLVAVYTQRQTENGFRLDYTAAAKLVSKLVIRNETIEDELQTIFPPIVTRRYSEKQVDKETGEPKRLKDLVEVFNPGSRQQIARRLEGKGVRWTKRTEKGNIIVDETTLKTHVDAVPEAKLMLEYLTNGKKAAMVKGWLEHYNPRTGRVHGRVNTVGAVTRRMTHMSPNVAQADSDHDTRSCWTVEDDMALVGIDASGLELRMLAHYLQDDEYTELILEGDIHWHNAISAGLADDVPYDEDDPELKAQRNQAKTFIYALLYGAGLAKIGSITGGGQAQGKILKENFIASLPAYGELVDRIGRIAAQGHLPGLDGSRVRVRHAHAALNSLLQSAGAFVMKWALVNAIQTLDEEGLGYLLVANVHDEFQIECRPADAKRVGQIVVDAIVQAGVDLGCRCPLDGEAKIGTTWAETH